MAADYYPEDADMTRGILQFALVSLGGEADAADHRQAYCAYCSGPKRPDREVISARVRQKVKQLAVEHARAAVDEMFVSKMATSESFTRANLFLPNEIMAGSEATEYLRASNPLARDFFSPEFKIFCEKSLHEAPTAIHAS